jgi:hypothetical protein
MPNSEEVALPCGNTGVREGLGVRCWTCMAIWGSIACPCSNEQRSGGAPPATQTTDTTEE